jgi:hypothetical protein
MAIVGLLGGLVCTVSAGVFAPGARFQRECWALEYFLREVQQAARHSRQHCFVGFVEMAIHADNPSERALFVAAYVRADGMRGFDNRNPRDSWLRDTIKPESLKLFRTPQHYPTLRLAASLPPPAEGAMARPPVSRYQRLGHRAADSETPVYALMSQNRTVEIRRVIHLHPDGASRVVHQSTAANLVHALEVGLVPRGTPPPPPDESGEDPPSTAPGTSGLHAAIQINGLTGRLQLYLPQPKN